MADDRALETIKYGHLCSAIEASTEAMAARRREIEDHHETFASHLGVASGMARPAQGEKEG